MANSPGVHPAHSGAGPVSGQMPTSKLPSTADLIEAMSSGLAKNWWAIALRGVLGIVFGILAFALPSAVMLSLALLFGAYCLIDGVLAIVAAVRAARERERWWLLLLEGMLNFVMAAVAFVFPAGAVLAFVLVTAVWAILSGATMIGSAFRLAVGAGRWWLVLGGVVSMVFGVLLVIAPLAGALVLTWWLGAYAVVFGVVMLILAFRLRRRRATGERFDQLSHHARQADRTACIRQTLTDAPAPTASPQ